MRHPLSIHSIGLVLLLVGCTHSQRDLADVRAQTASRMTVGKVQREIRVGMPSTEVLTVMGTPNIVQTDPNRQEVWVYDKVATEVVQSSSQGGVSSLLLGVPGPVGGGFSLGGGRRSAALSSSQRTLTVIIKFDKQSLVRDFSYHTSQF